MALMVVLAVGLVTLGLLVVLALSLIRHTKLLLGSVARFRDEAQPVLQDIRSASEATQARLEGLSRRAEAMGRGRQRGASAPVVD